MRKLWSSCIILLLVFVLFAGLMAIIFNNGNLSSNGFPLQRQWSIDLGSEVNALSTNEGEILLARTSNSLFALDMQSGKILWTHSLAWQAIPKPPIASKGSVYFADGAAIWALDEKSGKVLWSQSVPYQEADVKSVSDAAVAVDMAQDLILYDAKTGTKIWNKAACRNEIQAHILNDTVYVPCYGIRAINVISGNDEWALESTKRIAKVGYAGGVLYYSPDSNSVAAFDLVNRKMLWEVPFSGDGLRQFSAHGEYLAITDSDRLCLLNRETGERLWCAQMNNPQVPAIIGNTVYVFNGYLNEISAFELSSGQPVGYLKIRKLRPFIVHEELITSSNDTLFFGNGHRIFAFGAEE